MEEKKFSEYELNQLLDNYVAQNFETDAIELAKEDLRYGLSSEQVDLYLEKRLSIAQMRQLSRAMRAGLNNDFIKMLKDGNFKCRQLEVLIDYHLRGIPMDAIMSKASKDMSAHAINKVLSEVLAKMQEAKESVPKQNEQAMKMFQKIEQMVSGLGENGNFLQQVMEKLSKLDVIEQGNDDVREKLAKSIEDKERIITEQQNNLQQAAKECAELRMQLDAILEEKKSYEKELSKTQNEINTLRMANENLRKEKEEMEYKVSKPDKTFEKEIVSDTSDMDYQINVRTPYGKKQMVQVEHHFRRSADGILALAGKKLFKHKSRVNLIKHLTGKGLNREQMEQVKVAIEAGLTEEEVIDIINSGFSADEMKQAIQIVMAEKLYQ